ncbi:hypothetical protein J6590_003392 [Homalodisca vitripennis]|nr:hypothetical protein J6590_003392 [Homalodisca vitripennis]
MIHQLALKVYNVGKLVLKLVEQVSPKLSSLKNEFLSPSDLHARRKLENSSFAPKPAPASDAGPLSNVCHYGQLPHKAD